MTDTAGREHTLVLAVNVLKAAMAVIFIARPRSIRAWVGQTADDPGGTVLLRAFGIRDLSLSIGAIRARSADERRRWLLAGGVCDLFDAGLTARLLRTGRRHRLGPLATLTSGWAAASGLACIALASAHRHIDPSAAEPG